MSALSNLNPYELHKYLINEYILVNKGSTKNLCRDSSKDKRDFDVIRENHRFLWDDNRVNSWEQQLAKKYYDKLFKEYSICDLSKYKENKVALRWRIEKEVVDGKGQFICGNKVCPEKNGLKSWEVNFAYIEEQEKKNALVKLRLCVACSSKLNYFSKKREVKRLKKSDSNKYNKSKSEKKEVSKETISSDKNVTPVSDQSSSMKDIPSSSEEIWKKGSEPEEKTREEEFESYLEDLLL